MFVSAPFMLWNTVNLFSRIIGIFAQGVQGACSTHESAPAMIRWVARHPHSAHRRRSTLACRKHLRAVFLTYHACKKINRSLTAVSTPMFASKICWTALGEIYKIFFHVMHARTHAIACRDKKYVQQAKRFTCNSRLCSHCSHTRFRFPSAASATTLRR